jgi:hypothetical protein
VLRRCRLRRVCGKGKEMNTLAIIAVMSLPSLHQDGNHIEALQIGNWTASVKELSNGKVLLHWRWKQSKEAIGIGLYERDSTGNLIGLWTYRDRLTAKELLEVEAGDMQPLRLMLLDYVETKR